jgi:hypothetical protein
MIRWTAPAADQPRLVRVERWDYDLADDRFEESKSRELVLGE